MTKYFALQRICIGGALLAVAILSGCARPIEGTASYSTAPDGASAPLVKIDKLQDLVPAPAAIGKVIGAPLLTGIAAYTKPDSLPSGSVSEGDCISVMTPGEESVYRGSGYQAVFGRVDDDPSARRSSVGVAVFDSAEEADDFVKKQVESWRDCAGKALTVTLIGAPVTWKSNQPTRSNGVDVAVREQEQGQGYACGRGIDSWSNIVADVLVCSPDGKGVAEQSAAVTNLTLGNIPR